jgi:hypothetical protein
MTGFITPSFTAPLNHNQLQRYRQSANFTNLPYTLLYSSVLVLSSEPSIILGTSLHAIVFQFSWCCWTPSSNSLTLLSLSLSLSLILWPTVSRLVCLGTQLPSEAYDKIFITVRLLWVCWYGTLSLTRGWVYHLQLLLDLASAVIFGSESVGTCDHILLSQIRDFPFRRLLRLSGLRRWYFTPPPHGISLSSYRSQLSLYCLCTDFRTKPFHSCSV